MQAVDNQEFKQLRRHSHFYLNGGDLHFLVSSQHGDRFVVYKIRQLDNQLFRVHRFFFERESRKFRDAFLVPTSERFRKGDTESTAIILDVAVQDFEKLLGVFYNPLVTSAITWITLIQSSV